MVAAPVAVTVPVVPSAVISAAPSVPDTPVGAAVSNDLFSDVEVKTEKVFN